jgi:DNA-binding CsgD family transcriptional regulator
MQPIGEASMPVSRALSVGERGLAAISRIGATASSAAPVSERVEEIFDHLRTLIPIEAGLISAIDVVTRRSKVVINQGYPASFAAYLNGGDFNAEMIEPFALPLRGWPVRQRELPVDPLSLRSITEYFTPAGLIEGLLGALITTDGRYVGFIDISNCDSSHPSDEACAVVGTMAPTLANVVDPLQSARWLVSTLAEDCVAVGLLGGGVVVPLQGESNLELNSALYRAAARLLAEGPPTAAFLWPTSGGTWYECRTFRCRDHTLVLTTTEIKRPHELTRRELEVLSMLVDGHSNADIASQLSVAPRTVKAHVEHILEKLEVPSRAAAVGRAFQEGLLLLPETMHVNGFR